jgi:FdhD protein
MKPAEPFQERGDVAAGTYPVRRVEGNREHALTDSVAEEIPVALEFNGISYAVMLATPTDLDDFALGFALSEGVIDRSGELYDVEIRESSEGITLQARIPNECFVRLKERRRALAGRTGCGLCGVESLTEVVRPTRRVSANAHFEAARLLAGFDSLRERQPLMSSTGAVHAAAWLPENGTLLHVREDVGRHNALDKMLGALAREEVPACGAALVTSRASFEMVQKAGALGVPILAAISAPTGLAIRMADSIGMTLVGFARGQSLVCYTHPERIQLTESART